MSLVYELPFALFSRTKALFAQTWFDEMYMEAVLNGRQQGRIFVDDPEAPAAAIMFRTYEFYVAGSPEVPDLRRFIRAAPAEPGVFQGFHSYAPIGKAWEKALLEDYGADLELLPRCNFRWVFAPILDWRHQLPAGAHVVPITRALAERIDREWQETIGLLWDGYEHFERDGYGFCLMMGDELGSMVTTDGVGERAVNIGVRTAPQFRRQGLAKLVCSAFIEHTLERGLLPTWDTDERNTGSKALARSLGFVEREPFSELIRPHYGPLVLSEGLWEASPPKDGVIFWSSK